MTTRNSHLGNILNQYRIAALSTPLSAYEMTDLDKEMTDILTRTDLTTGKKLKKYYETLSKFQNARDIFEKVNQKPPRYQQLNSNKLNYPDNQAHNTTDEDDDEIEQSNNTGEDIFFTPVNNTEKSPDRTERFNENHNRIESSDTPFVSPVRSRLATRNIKELHSRTEEILRDVLEKYAVKHSKNTKKDFLARPSPSKAGEYVRLGNVEEVEPIIKYLLSDGTMGPPKKGIRQNIKLTEAVADVLLKPKYFDLTDVAMSQEYPVLDTYSYAKVAAPKTPSPPQRKKKKRGSIKDEKQTGRGEKKAKRLIGLGFRKKNIRVYVPNIDFVRWNKLIHG
jgi:hypothetical protein